MVQASVHLGSTGVKRTNGSKVPSALASSASVSVVTLVKVRAVSPRSVRYEPCGRS